MLGFHRSRASESCLCLPLGEGVLPRDGNRTATGGARTIVVHNRRRRGVSWYLPQIPKKQRPRMPRELQTSPDTERSRMIAQIEGFALQARGEAERALREHRLTQGCLDVTTVSLPTTDGDRRSCLTRQRGASSTERVGR